MNRVVIALGAWLVLWNTAFVPSLSAQDPAADQKADKVTERVVPDTDGSAEGTGTDPVKIGTPETKLEKFCEQDENKKHEKCADAE